MSTKKSQKLANFDDAEQSNKKHRAKSKKLEKRENKRKNKKKEKKSRYQLHIVRKHIKKFFLKENKYIHFDSLTLDLADIDKYISRLLDLDANCSDEIVSLFKAMEEKKCEVDVSELENKLVQATLIKLFKKLKIYSVGLKNPFTFKIVKTTKDKSASKARFTTDESEIIANSLESYSLFIEAFFDFVKNRELIMAESKKARAIVDEDEYQNDNNHDGDEGSDDSDHTDSQIDNDYDNIERTLGNNAELINKTFDIMMRGDDQQFLGSKREKKPEVDFPFSKNLKKQNLIISNSTVLDSNDKISNSEDDSEVGPKASDFLKSTFSLINNADEFDQLLDRVTTPAPRTLNHKKENDCKSKINVANHLDRIVNKKEYLQIQSEYDQKNKVLQAEAVTNQKKISLLQEHQMKKNGVNPNTSIMAGINSKKTLQMLQQNSNLDSRFVNKEKI